ncbi:hypothetical protein GE09DRAFT_952469 [Coniochaeta sp. 2T2.1]|nr:hypothetical protein GE09DRAFT_952469 [Coniochaeta sp. 2T2.1]
MALKKPSFYLLVFASLSTAVPDGSLCGVTADNAVCDAGLCCSEAGICGTGTAFCAAPGCQLSFGPSCDGNQAPAAGSDTSSTPRPQFGNVPYGVDLSHCTLNGMVALTFDDGPYVYTPALLDVLAQNSVRATFFVVGDNGGKGQIQDPSTGYPAIIRRMIAEGHQIGSHTWGHQDLAVLTAQQRRDQIILNEIALVEILGYFPTYMRPPYTSWNADALLELGELGYHVFNYDIDTRDWAGDYGYAQSVYTSTLSQNSPSSSSWISLEHDIQEQTVSWFAQYLIDQARSLGYQLVTLGECLGDPPANWYRDPITGEPYAGASGANTSAATAVPSSSSSPFSAPASSSEPSAAISSASSSPSAEPTPTPVPNVNFHAGTSPNDRPGYSEVGFSPTTTAVRPAAPTGSPPDAPLKSGAGRNLSLLQKEGPSFVICAAVTLVIALHWFF